MNHVLEIGFVCGPQIDEPARSFANDGIDGGVAKGLLGEISRAGVPEHIKFKIRDWPPCLAIKPGFQIIQVLPGDPGRNVRVLVSQRIGITPPHPGQQLIAADFTGAASGSIIISRLDHANRLQAGKPCVRSKRDTEQGRRHDRQDRGSECSDPRQLCQWPCDAEQKSNYFLHVRSRLRWPTSGFVGRGTA